MSETNKLSIQKRERSSKGAMNQLRREGYLPGSISQKGSDAISFSIKKDEFRKALNANGMSAVYMLQADKKTAYPAMVREIQYAPMTRDWLHVTFQLVSLTEETTAEVPFLLVGRDDVTHRGFELLQQLETLLVKGLPGKFPSHIEINVSEMEPGSQVTVADLTLPEGIAAETDADRLILSVSYPRVQAEDTPAEESAEATEGAEPADSAAEDSEG